MSLSQALAPREQAILNAIEKAARSGEPCPDNATLACIIDASSISSPVAYLKRLEEKGVVRVKRYQRGRQVTIVTSGLSTREPANRQPHWRDRGKRSYHEIRDDLAERVANGQSVLAAGRALGFAQAFTYKLWKEIRQGLGWQAS